jgi:hypothetical protein
MSAVIEPSTINPNSIRNLLQAPVGSQPLPTPSSTLPAGLQADPSSQISALDGGGSPIGSGRLGSSLSFLRSYKSWRLPDDRNRWGSRPRQEEAWQTAEKEDE